MESLKLLPTLFCSAASMAVVVASDAPGAPASFEAKGLLAPYEHAKLASRAKGVIEQIKREGEVVKKGEVVLQLESDIERLQREQQKQILELRAFERAASDELASKSVISKTEVEEKRVNYEVAKTQLELSERIFETKKVFAPFDGIVSERLRERGEAVDEFTPVITLANLRQLYLEVFLPASRVRDVRIGDAVEVKVDDLPGRDFAGKVAEFAPAVNPASGDFKVRVLVSNDSGELVSGTPACVVFGKP